MLEDIEAPEIETPNIAKELSEELLSFFAGDLNPVAPRAQKKVPVPEG